MLLEVNGVNKHSLVAGEARFCTCLHVVLVMTDSDFGDD